ncbi:MAG: hypothetical protein ACHQT6_06485 [Candidatus Acidiferrales bacterium]
MRNGMMGLAVLCAVGGVCRAQQVPAVSGARILLLPRKIVTGERSTLAVLDVSGRLTPGVTVVFSNGDKVTTDATGRALFVGPLNPGVIFASLEGRAGRVTSVIVSPAEVPSSSLEVILAPRVANVSDRFEISGHGFCGDADANKVSIGGAPGLVLAASPAYLAVLPPAEMNPGSARVEVSCGARKAAAFTVLFVSLELEANGTALAPGEHRELTVRVRGSMAKINMEARNLAPDVADLQGGTTVRAASSGGVDNVARFALQGKQHGSFLISIRLVAPLVTPGP